MSISFDDSESYSRPAVQQPPNPLIYLDSQALLVEDVDEEIFDLYANIAGHREQATSANTGLGFVSSLDDVYQVEFELGPARKVPPSQYDKSSSKISHRSRHTNKLSRTEPPAATKTVTAEIAQDLNSLRNRKGDTGSIIWRSRYECLPCTSLISSSHHRSTSLFLAKQILQQYYYPVPSTPTSVSKEHAASAKVLELGAGTGVLGILLHQLFGTWTATDQYDHLKLIARNIKSNGCAPNLQVEEVDWADVHERWVKGNGKASYAKEINDNNRADTREQYDLIVAVDCIYNEALIPPFVSTLEYYTAKGKTVVLVVCELRSVEVVTLLVISHSVQFL
ncbi:hypothetical protein QFC21_000770 [Naganishia friedmannii]|uniref:Uncharacterized protein n=1 Tax=Naganishia friedmannii TaxID=89922 RepID=A0ACC2W6F8_9TREE|nr:hypothetical protein QFC21_000770 [Naganishia friedmannii]